MNINSIPVYQKDQGNLKKNELLTFRVISADRTLYAGKAKPHRHDYYSILLVLSGKTVQFLDFMEYEIKQPTVLLMHPDQVHYEVETIDAEMVLITFKESLLLDHTVSFDWKDIFNITQISLSPAQVEEFKLFLKVLETEYSKLNSSEKVLSFLLSAILEKIRLFFKPQDDQEEGKTHRILKSYRKLVEQYALEEERVSFYAKKLFISPGHLNDIVKKMTGRNAKSFLNERQILEAKRMLFWTEHSIQEVAWKTGFKDPAYFTRFFKKHTGMLPGEFQRKSKENST